MYMCKNTPCTVGSVLPEEGEGHKFLQIYFMASVGLQLDKHCSTFAGVDRTIVTDLQASMHVLNSCVQSIKTVLGAAAVPGMKLKVVQTKYLKLSIHDALVNQE